MAETLLFTGAAAAFIVSFVFVLLVLLMADEGRNSWFRRFMVSIAYAFAMTVLYGVTWLVLFSIFK